MIFFSFSSLFFCFCFFFLFSSLLSSFFFSLRSNLVWDVTSPFKPFYFHVIFDFLFLTFLFFFFFLALSTGLKLLESSFLFVFLFFLCLFLYFWKKLHNVASGAFIFSLLLWRWKGNRDLSAINELARVNGCCVWKGLV